MMKKSFPGYCGIAIIAGICSYPSLLQVQGGFSLLDDGDEGRRVVGLGISTKGERVKTSRLNFRKAR